MTLTPLLESGFPLLLDGAMGTELQRRGVDVGLPLWSARALITSPHQVRNIHFAHLTAGADVITTNSFRTNIRTLERAGIHARWEELNLRAVQLAFEARDRYREARPVLIAGSIAPVEDCYSPSLVPSDAELEREHGMQAALLSEAGVDFFLLETMNSAREALAASRAAALTGKEFAVSFVCSADGKLLSGEDLSEAIHLVEPFSPALLCVNCVSAADIHISFARLRSLTSLPIGLYANVGIPRSNGITMREDVTLADYIDRAHQWLEMGARLIGGCCGTTPEHVEGMNLARRDIPPSGVRRQE